MTIQKCKNCASSFHMEAVPKLVPVDPWWCAHCQAHFSRKERERVKSKLYAYAGGVILTQHEFMSLMPIDPKDQKRPA